MADQNQPPQIMTARVNHSPNDTKLLYQKSTQEIKRKYSGRGRAMSHTKKLNTSRGSAFSPLSCYLESINEQSDSSYNSLSSEQVNESNLTTRQQQSLFFKGSKKVNNQICAKSYLKVNPTKSQKRTKNSRHSDLVLPS